MIDVFMDQSHVQTFPSHAETQSFVKQRLALPKAYKTDPTPEFAIVPRKPFSVFRIHGAKQAFVASFDTEGEARAFIATRHYTHLANLAAIGHATSETVDKVWRLQEDETTLPSITPVEAAPAANLVFDPTRYAPKVPSTARADVRFNEEHFEFDTDTEASAFADAYAKHRGLSRTLLQVSVRKPVRVLQGGSFVTSFDTVAQANAYVAATVQEQTVDRPEVADLLRARYTVVDTAPPPPVAVVEPDPGPAAAPPEPVPMAAPAAVAAPEPAPAPISWDEDFAVLVPEVPEVPEGDRETFLPHSEAAVDVSLETAPEGATP